MSFFDHLRRYRRLLGSIGFAVGVIAAIGLLAHCRIARGDQANWTKTEGVLGTRGEVRVDKDGNESGGSVEVFYKDPDTGHEMTAKMHVGSRESAQAILDRPDREIEPVYIYKGLTGKPDVCTQTDWAECRERALPPWWVFPILAALLAFALFDLRSRWRSVVAGHQRVGAGHHTYEYEEDD